MNTCETDNLHDNFLHLDFYDDNIGLPISRRQFLKTFGFGIFVLFTVGSGKTDAQHRDRSLPDDVNAFLRIGEDGRVTCFTGKVEMGQGIITSLAMMLADELGVAYESVDMVMGDTDLCPWDRGTFGSLTTRTFGPPLRAAAAEARSILLQLAEAVLKLPKEKLTVKNGVVSATPTSAQVTYAQLTMGKKITRRVKGKSEQAKPANFTIMGKPRLRRDAEAKVTGKAQYAGDIRIPGMLHARILRPPAHDAQLTDVDTSAVTQLKGAVLIKEADLTAVLHEDPEQAEFGLNLIKAAYQRPPSSGLNQHTIFGHLLKNAPEGDTVAQGGNVSDAKAEFRAEATYLDGYVAHAPIETHTALAHVQGAKATIWASTQTPFALKDQAAEALGVTPDNVRVIPPYLGGGFGGKSSNRQAIEAVKLSKLCSKPVQVAWTRKEEFFYDTFRPAALVKIDAGVTKDGGITYWDYGVYLAGQRGALQFYDIPNHRTIAYGSGWRTPPGTHPFGTGAWRAPANNTNTFARESHIDTLAAAAKIDPIEFRLKNLKDPRMIGVLKTCAQKFGWKPTKKPGRGFGTALGIDADTYVALMAEVEVDQQSGKIRVVRVTCAQDMGLCVNPEGAVIQAEGCITMGLGYALTEEIRFRDGEILDENFDTYDIPRFSWTPQMEIVIIDDKEAPPHGGGEPAIICMGAVIANAVYDACGARMLQLPMTAERVKKKLT